MEITYYIKITHPLEQGCLIAKIDSDRELSEQEILQKFIAFYSYGNPVFIRQKTCRI